MATQTVENYLKAIYKLSEDLGNEELVSTNALAAELETAAASVTDMVKKLDGRGLLKYTPYQGVRLSEMGQRHALDTIRKHRLWELFLVDTLNFSWDEVHDVAEQLEHIQSPVLTERLSEYLGHPTHDPHGDPIPDQDGNIAQRNEIALSEMNAGQSGTLVGVKTDASDLLQYLDRVDLKLETNIRVEDRMEFDGSLRISYKGQEQTLSSTISANLLISPIS